MGAAVAAQLVFLCGSLRFPVVYDASLYDTAGYYTAELLRGRTVPQLPLYVQVIRDRGPGYPLFLGLVYLLGNNSSESALVAQAGLVLIALAGWLLVLVRRAGWLAAVLLALLWALYQPFVHAAGLLFTEPLLLGLTGLLAAVVLDRRPWGPGRMMAAGALLAAISLTKPAWQYFPFLFIACGIADLALARSWRRDRHGAWAVLVYLLLGIVAWQAIAAGVLGVSGFLGQRRAPVALVFGYDSKVMAWEPDDLYDYDVSYATFRQEVRERPLAALMLIPMKFFRVWWCPANEWKVGTILSVPAERLFHRAVILLGLLGMASWLRCFPRRRFLAAASILYTAAVFSLSQGLGRYNLIAMPAVLAAAACGLAAVLRRAARNPGSLLFPGALLLGALLFTFTPFPLGEMLIGSAVLTTWVQKGAATALLLGIWRLVRGPRPGLPPVPLAIVLALPLLGALGSSALQHPHRPIELRLDRPGDELRKVYEELMLPEDCRRVEVRLDGYRPVGGAGSWQVRVETELGAVEETLDVEQQNQRRFWGPYKMIRHLRRERMEDCARYRQWFTMEIPRDLWRGARRLEIRVTPVLAPPAAPGRPAPPGMRMLGQLLPQSATRLVLPDFVQQSYVRWQLQDDHRIPKWFQLRSDPTRVRASYRGEPCGNRFPHLVLIAWQDEKRFLIY